jgi:predicted dehydrogenase/threonine dehydrogenase-like Zn-dependent dehydrogenase
MKQLIQSPRSGVVSLIEVPVPGVDRGEALVRVAASAVSVGTDRMVAEFASKSLVQKARSRPDLVKQVIDKAMRDGPLAAVDAVRNRLNQPMPLGYSCAGTVLAIGTEIRDIRVGQRVACAGMGHASHAEVVAVPRNLVVEVPETVTDESAAFTTLGAIALQGVRLSEAKLGEVVAVIGLGMLGQLTVQILRANGCVVIAMDVRQEPADLARRMGAAVAVTGAGQLVAACAERTGGHGADAVIITAGTSSDEPIDLAGEVARDKGIVVAVGAVGMNVPRRPFYLKELDLRVGRSYGPGRYDPIYEEQGHDYPYAYVRWTEQRNMQAVLQLMADRQVLIEPLITHRFPIDQAPDAYTRLSDGKEPFMGVVLTYPGTADLSTSVRAPVRSAAPTARAGLPVVRLGVIGAGSFARAVVLPILHDLQGAQPVAVASGSGLSARAGADRLGCRDSTTDVNGLLARQDIDAVAILTRHHLHAPQVLAALEAGKHVFVEKPLCLTDSELDDIIAAQGQNRLALMVGFNRRFAPFVIELRRRLATIREPLMLHYRVNAGYLPRDHWTQDPAIGGGRLLGEGCHFVDLLLHLAGSEPRRVTCRSLPDLGRYSADNLTVTVECANGSTGVLTYVANGDRAFSKESLEVFGGGLAASLVDYRSLTICQHGRRDVHTRWLRQDKGHRAIWRAWVSHLRGEIPDPLPFNDLVTSTITILAAERSRQTGGPVEISGGELPGPAVRMADVTGKG